MKRHGIEDGVEAYLWPDRDGDNCAAQNVDSGCGIPELRGMYSGIVPL